MEGRNKTGEGPLVSIVDDDVSVRRSTLRLLGSAGWRAEAFASAEEFLASGRTDETACLILDLRMPGMSGLQLQQRLVGASHPLRIIFLSARSSAEEQRQALEAGAVQFLHKPVGGDVLLLALREALKTLPDDDERKTP
jgi:FixJ family two-component response regulator